jgi:hypothetical protein
MYSNKSKKEDQILLSQQPSPSSALTQFKQHHPVQCPHTARTKTGVANDLFSKKSLAFFKWFVLGVSIVDAETQH